jgi:uncharacterized protein YceK
MFKSKAGLSLKKLTATFMIMFAGISIVGLSGCSTASSHHAHGHGVTVASAPGGIYADAGTPAASATKVTVGMYGVNAYEIDTASNTFYFKGYMWLRWAGDADPVSSLEFANSVEEWGLMVTNLTEEPVKLADGQNLMTMRVQGRFFQPFDLSNYPLDAQVLQITLEDSVNDNTAIVYVPDTTDSTYDASFKVPGWTVDGITADQLTHTYDTNFGDTSITTSKYSALSFNIGIDRAENLFWWKLLLPLALVLITNWLALLISPRLVEVRTAMPATALLTTVFLQQSSLDAIPQVSSLVLMDLIYVVAYGAIVLTFAQIIWDNHKGKNDEEEVVASIARADRWSLLLQVIATLAVIAWLVVSHS